jgi:hypothetical protein
MKHLSARTCVFSLVLTASLLAIAQSLPRFGTAKFGQAVFGVASLGTALMRKSKEKTVVKYSLGKQSTSLVLGALLGAFLGATNVYSAPASINIDSFSGSETVIDFNTIADEELITNQFTASTGVTFSGAIYGMTNQGDLDLVPDNGGVIASNWLYNVGSSQGLSFSADLGGSYTKVGFHAYANGGDSVTIEVLGNGASSGSVTFESTGAPGAPSPGFIAVEDANGFDSITISVLNNMNAFLTIDNLRFEGGDADGDGVLDSEDQCANTPSSETADSSGCGPSQRDSDGDGTNDAEDAFPSDPTETADSDNDGVGDNADPFPNDPTRSALPAMPVPLMPALVLLLLAGLLGLLGGRRLKL